MTLLLERILLEVKLNRDKIGDSWIFETKWSAYNSRTIAMPVLSAVYW